MLVAEDFEVLAEAIAKGLRHEGMAVDVAPDGGEALERIGYIRYDVVVLDRDLPVVHGDEVCRRIVAGDSGSRVLMLTAASTVADRVDGPRPRRRRLPAQAVRLRRAGRQGAGAGPAVGPGDSAGAGARRAVGSTRRAGWRFVTDGGSTCRPKEFAVLECLLAAGDQVVSAEELLERVWDE